MLLGQNIVILRVRTADILIIVRVFKKTMDPEGLLYSNKFVPAPQDINFETADRSRARNQFREFYEATFGKPTFTAYDAATLAPDDILQTNAATTSITRNDIPDDAPRRCSLVSKVVCIDSKDRNMNIYQDPNSYRVYLSEHFQNIRKVRLLSFELPYSEQLIKSQPANKKNNKLYWQNGSAEPDAGYTYSLTLTSGNYSSSKFTNEIVNRTASVQRFGMTSSTGDPVYSDFSIDLSGTTNVFTIRQNNSYTLDNPLSTESGSAVVTVTQNNHELLPGQVVNMSGAITFGGIAAKNLNSSQVIDVNIQRIDNLYRDSVNNLTLIEYATTQSALTGRVNARKGKRFIHGMGTNFKTSVKSGDVVHVGYYNYTVENVVTDFLLTTEEPLEETFNKYNLIKNLSQSDTNAFDVVTGDPSRTTVNVINHRLRNINTTSTTELEADKLYESDFLDFSGLIYKAAQPIIKIYSSDFIYSQQVMFDSIDPTYNNFSFFRVLSSIETFNVATVTASNNVLSLLSASGSALGNYQLPQGSYSMLQLPSLISTTLSGWSVLYNSSLQRFYFQTPATGSTATVTIPSAGISDTYFLFATHGIDFTAANSPASLLGFQSTVNYGTIAMSSTNVNSSAAITLQGGHTSIYILAASNNSLLYTATLSRLVYLNVLELVDLLKSTLLNLGIPIDVSYVAGIQRVIFTPNSSSFRFRLMFRKSTTVIGVGAALGFDTTFLHENVCLRSVFQVKSYLPEAYYTHPLMEVFNAAKIFPSQQCRGTAIVMNNSNVVTGQFDLFDYTALVQNSLAVQTTGTNNVVGQISQNTWRITTPGSAETGHTYFTLSAFNATYTPDTYLAAGRRVTVLVVTVVSGRFQFTNPETSEIFAGDTPLTIEKGATTLFDLRNVPDTSRFKLSEVQNGEYNTGTTGVELTKFRRYFFDGDWLMLNVPLDDTVTDVLYFYDDLSASAIDTNFQAQTYYFSKPGDYLCVADEPAILVPVATPAPQLVLYVGRIYTLEYSQVLIDTASNFAGIDQLKLSLSLDGLHAGGIEFTANYITYTSTSISLDLRAQNLPFPERVYYYSKTTAGAGGAGYFTIKQPNNAGAIVVSAPYYSTYDVYLSGAIPYSLNNDSRYVTDGYTVLLSPFNALGSLTVDNPIYLIDSTVSDACNIMPGAFNVTYDNNRFNVIDNASQVAATISLTPGYRSLLDISVDIQAQLNEAFELTSADLQFSVIYDTTNNIYNFTVNNGRTYSFDFLGFDIGDGSDLYNSAAEILGFAQTDRPTNASTPMGIVQASQAFSSSLPCNLSLSTKHTIKIKTSDVSGVSLQSPMLSWSELLQDADNTSLTALVRGHAAMRTGTRFTTDLSVGENVLLGTDLDVVFTVVNIESDVLLQLNTNAVFVAATVDATTGDVIPAPSTPFTVRIFKAPTSTALFSNDEKLVFFRDTQAKSTYDYDGGLVGQNLQLTRVSPVKLSIVETDKILQASAADTDNTYNFNKITNHNLYFIKNNSKWSFNTPYPATATVNSRGGNPVTIGTGVKFRLLFSRTDTPGTLLGFPNVGLPSGDTTFKTVHSNTVEDDRYLSTIVRSEVGVAPQSGFLKVITSAPHKFEYGDTVYIEGHTGSSNDLALNSDEGYIITLDNTQLTFVETENGIVQTRGVFYIPLSLSAGGIGGVAYKKQLYQPFSLAGENYLYLICPTLATLSTTTPKVSNVFAKLLLNAPPGEIIFNSYVTSDKLFDDAPLATLDYLDFQIVNPEGDLTDFNNLNHSFSLEITYESIAPDGTQRSSRTNTKIDESQQRGAAIGGATTQSLGVNM